MMRAALEALAKVDEVWLAGVMPEHWGARNGRWVRHERQPSGADAVTAYVEQVGADGAWPLQAVHAADAPVQAATQPAVDVLRQVWVQQFWCDEISKLPK